MCSNDNVAEQTRSKVTAPLPELELELEFCAPSDDSALPKEWCAKDVDEELKDIVDETRKGSHLRSRTEGLLDLRAKHFMMNARASGLLIFCSEFGYYPALTFMKISRMFLHSSYGYSLVNISSTLMPNAYTSTSWL